MLHMYHSGKSSSFVVDPFEDEQPAVGVYPHAFVLTAFDHPQYTSLVAFLISFCQKQHGKVGAMSLWAAEKKRGNVDDL